MDNVAVRVRAHLGAGPTLHPGSRGTENGQGRMVGRAGPGTRAHLGAGPTLHPGSRGTENGQGRMVGRAGPHGRMAA